MASDTPNVTHLNVKKLIQKCNFLFNGKVLAISDIQMAFFRRISLADRVNLSVYDVHFFSLMKQSSYGWTTEVNSFRFLILISWYAPHGQLFYIFPKKRVVVHLDSEIFSVDLYRYLKHYIMSIETACMGYIYTVNWFW